MRFNHQLRYFGCLVLVALFGVFLSFHFLSQQGRAYADDGTPIQSASKEYFVTIHDQDSNLIVKTGPVTVREVLERAEVPLAETDIVEPALDTRITSDYHINVYRARPAIIIDGVVRKYVMTASYDPKQIAIEAGLTVYDGDTFETEFNSSFLETGAVSSYRIVRNGGRTITLDEAIPYTTEIRYDNSLNKGEQYLEQAGEDGRRISVYTVSFENNIEVSRELTSEEVVSEPVMEVLVVGTKISIPPERQQCADWAREAGVEEQDLEAALDLMYRESGCRIDATNASSGAYGIPQALPGSKMATKGEDWETNPVTQIRWMIDYVNTRYGGWQEALDYWWCIGTCTSRLGTIYDKRSYWY